MKKFLMIDDRWGDYIPWFLRYSGQAGAGNFNIFFSRIGQRLERVFKYNEFSIGNTEYFGACLESESLQRFQHRSDASLNTEIRNFLDPIEIRNQVVSLMANDPEEQAVKEITRNKLFYNLQRLATGEPSSDVYDVELETARGIVTSTYTTRFNMHFSRLARERLGVVEVLLRMLPNLPSAKESLITDIRKYFAEANIPLTIRGSPPLIVPFEETLLESEIIGKLLPRLEAQFPERAKELIIAYHDLMGETKTLDSIFSEAFKTLEEIAREVTGNPAFLFDQSNMEKHFGRLHPTTKKTINNLAAHRGDKAGHARSAPEPEEMRYLLFEICNIALLILDYRKM